MSRIQWVRQHPVSKQRAGFKPQDQDNIEQLYAQHLSTTTTTTSPKHGVHRIGLADGKEYILNFVSMTLESMSNGLVFVLTRAGPPPSPPQKQDEQQQQQPPPQQKEPTPPEDPTTAPLSNGFIAAPEHPYPPQLENNNPHRQQHQHHAQWFFYHNALWQPFSPTESSVIEARHVAHLREHPAGVKKNNDGGSAQKNDDKSSYSQPPGDSNHKQQNNQHQSNDKETTSTQTDRQKEEGTSVKEEDKPVVFGPEPRPPPPPQPEGPVAPPNAWSRPPTAPSQQATATAMTSSTTTSTQTTTTTTPLESQQSSSADVTVALTTVLSTISWSTFTQQITTVPQNIATLFDESKKNKTRNPFRAGAKFLIRRFPPAPGEPQSLLYTTIMSGQAEGEKRTTEEENTTKTTTTTTTTQLGEAQNKTPPSPLITPHFLTNEQLSQPLPMRPQHQYFLQYVGQKKVAVYDYSRPQAPAAMSSKNKRGLDLIYHNYYCTVSNWITNILDLIGSPHRLEAALEWDMVNNNNDNTTTNNNTNNNNNQHSPPEDIVVDNSGLVDAIFNRGPALSTSQSHLNPLRQPPQQSTTTTPPTQQNNPPPQPSPTTTTVSPTRIITDFPHNPFQLNIPTISQHNFAIVHGSPFFPISSQGHIESILMRGRVNDSCPICLIDFVDDCCEGNDDGDNNDDDENNNNNNNNNTNNDDDDDENNDNPWSKYTTNSISQTPRCGHLAHTVCIQFVRAANSSTNHHLTCCPCCRSSFGMRMGSQPDGGVMSLRYDHLKRMPQQQLYNDVGVITIRCTFQTSSSYVYSGYSNSRGGGGSYAQETTTQTFSQHLPATDEVWCRVLLLYVKAWAMRSLFCGAAEAERRRQQRRRQQTDSWLHSNRPSLKIAAPTEAYPMHTNDNTDFTIALPSSSSSSRDGVGNNNNSNNNDNNNNNNNNQVTTTNPLSILTQHIYSHARRQNMTLTHEDLECFVDIYDYLAACASTHPTR